MHPIDDIEQAFLDSGLTPNPELMAKARAYFDEFDRRNALKCIGEAFLDAALSAFIRAEVEKMLLNRSAHE